MTSDQCPNVAAYRLSEGWVAATRRSDEGSRSTRVNMRQSLNGFNHRRWLSLRLDQKPDAQQNLMLSNDGCSGLCANIVPGLVAQQDQQKCVVHGSRGLPRCEGSATGQQPRFA